MKQSQLLHRQLPRYTGLIFLLLTSARIFAVETQSPQPVLILGIYPYQSAAILVERYKPLADYLSHKTGRRIAVDISKDYSTHIESIGKDKLDIAYMGPASYVEMVKRYGRKTLLARQAIHGKPVFQGNIVVRHDSALDSLSALAGKRFAFVDPDSTMGHLVPRYMLLQSGVTIKQLATHRFLGSHDNAALAVLAGDFDAGAVNGAVYKKYQARGLKSLAITPALSEHLLLSSNKLSTKTRQALREALLTLKDDPQGQSIMNAIKTGMTAWVAVTDSDYDNLRTIIDTRGITGVQK